MIPPVLLANQSEAGVYRMHVYQLTLPHAMDVEAVAPSICEAQ